MTAAAALHGRVLSRRTAVALGAAGAALFAANSAWHALGLGAQQVRSDVGDAPGIAGLALVLAALVASTWRARLLSAGPARWLGSVSYGLYLLHFPIIVALRETGRWPDALGQQLAAVLGVALPLSVALWIIVERPAIRWAQGVTGGARRAPAPPRQRAAEQPALRLRPAER
jgi:peptidoglycan/LPS O-acetylase OafA/YrhL